MPLGLVIGESANDMYLTSLTQSKYLRTKFNPNSPSGSYPWIYGFDIPHTSWFQPQNYRCDFTNNGGWLIGLIIGNPLIVF